MKSKIIIYSTFYLVALMKTGALEIDLFDVTANDYLRTLSLLLTEIAFITSISRCFVVITDDAHHELYNEDFFECTRRIGLYYYLKVNDTEDLLAPDYQTVKVLKKIRETNCDLYFVTILNAAQLKRFLKFVEKQRILNLQQKFVFLYDSRLLEPDMLYIWSNMISSTFLRWEETQKRFSIFNIAFPNILNGKFIILRHLTEWYKGKKLNKTSLFPLNTNNLKGFNISIAVYTHVPMVSLEGNSVGKFVGLEIEIISVLAKAMNFQPNFYKSTDALTERWGRELPDGSYSGLLGEVINRKAKIAIGDLHLYKLYTNVIDFSWPHSYECLTFLTPESSQDNSWKTLILPFSGGMWAGVLLSLFIVGTVFYMTSFLHASLLRKTSSANSEKFFVFLRRKRPKISARDAFSPTTFRSSKFRSELNRMRIKRKNEDLFDNFGNCLLYTYSMLLYVSLPRMPRNWPLRVLTGWYWMYCLLLTVTYRASFTAILANPAPKITIDSIEELVSSGLIPSVWGKETKSLFEDAFDVRIQEIGSNMEITNDIENIASLIANGKYAYYDNIYYLRHLRTNLSDYEILHIMRDCIIQMPTAIGLEKNSPLKLQIDKHILRMQEAGLIKKWLQDKTKNFQNEESAPQEALMDLQKFWSSFVALSIGYFLSVCAIIAEKWHFKKVVCTHPLYDVYNPKLYYNFKRRYPNVA